jgi:hypothetical protein
LPSARPSLAHQPHSPQAWPLLPSSASTSEPTTCPGGLLLPLTVLPTSRPTPSVNRFLDRVPLSVPGAAAIAAYSFFKARTILGPSLHFLDHVRANRWLSLLLAFVALKTLHRTLNRLTRNHGWKADPPVWSFDKGKGDVVLITGGSTGIGKEMVEILSRKTNKIAVIDLAPPTYDARESWPFRRSRLPAHPTRLPAQTAFTTTSATLPTRQLSQKSQRRFVQM